MSSSSVRFLCLAALTFGPMPCTASPNPQAVSEVLSGQRTEARASWWGFDPADSTRALQAAIDSGAKRVIVEKAAEPWVVDPIRLRGAQEIVFEPGVEVRAKRGGFRGTSDCLFLAKDIANLTLRGLGTSDTTAPGSSNQAEESAGSARRIPGATLRMWREDYASTNYAPAEWRHVISLRGCSNVEIAGLALSESGGDGIYVGVGANGGPCVNVRIRDVVCDRHHRQGISVISAENLLIENCTLKNTGGTAPMAAIDFEPNRPTERLVNCVMRGCTAENNRGHAYLFALHQLTAASPPLSMRIENCASLGTNRGSVAIHTRNGGPQGTVGGEIIFSNCRFQDAGTAGIAINSKPASGACVRFENCRVADPAEKPALAAPIRLASRPGDTEPVGGIAFADLVLAERADRPAIEYQDRFGTGIAGITGRLVLERGGKRDTVTIDKAFLARVIPAASVDVLPPFPMAGVRFEPAAPPSANAKIPPHKLRGETTLLVHACKGDAVGLRLAHGTVGKNLGGPLPVSIKSPSGKTVASVNVPPGGESDCAFTASETGVFRVDCEPKRDWLRALSSTHPFCLSGADAPVHFIGTQGELCFLVPAGTKEFAVRVCGENADERVKADVLGPDGKSVWQEDNITTMRAFQGKPGDASRDEVWRIRLARPSQGVLEDFHVDLRGIPPLWSFRPEDLLRPARE